MPPPSSTASAEPGLALVLHALTADPPAHLSRHLHNVPPAVLHDRLTGIKRRFRFVTVDEFAAAADRRGLAAITVDDGYRSAVEEGFPVCQDLDIPMTVFLNGIPFEGGTLWRDRVRLIVNLGLEPAWETFTSGRFHVPGKDMYRATKDPRHDQQAIDAALNAFLESAAADPRVSGGLAHIKGMYCANPDQLVRHPLISYGNHTRNHYLLPTLDTAAQAAEIDHTRRLLGAIPGIRKSELLALPFGNRNSFTHETVAIAAELGIRGILLSRPRVRHRAESIAGIPMIERLLAPARDIDSPQRADIPCRT